MKHRDSRIDQIPPRAWNRANAERATKRLIEAGLNDDQYQVRISARHWCLLRYFVQQRPEDVFADEDYDGPKAIELIVQGAKGTHLHELRRLNILTRFAKRNPNDRRLVLWYTWLITPEMLQAAKEALKILEEDNANNYFFEEDHEQHADRLWRSCRETQMLRRRLLDLLNGRDEHHPNWPQYGGAHPAQYQDPNVLMGLLGLQKERCWYGIRLAPTEPDPELDTRGRVGSLQGAIYHWWETDFSVDLRPT